MSHKTYTCKTKLWRYPGKAGWFFATIPTDIAQEIRERFGRYVRGFKSIPVTAQVGKTKWETSIFPDTRTQSYLLPIKREVRKQEGIVVDSEIMLTITINVGA